MYDTNSVPRWRDLLSWLFLGAAIGMFLTLGSVYLAKPSRFRTICGNGTQFEESIVDTNNTILGAMLLFIGIVSIPIVLMLPRFLRFEQLRQENSM